jgi:heme/copper-type cytochrome/quinol oxidase subunit 2
VHSWAIPGLGIKIDCIPGYNSHRRVMFRWRGIYWGQCMEVCGRYHHWMPILIRIVHRDVFLSWCLIYVRALNSRSVTSTQTKHNAVVALSWLNESNRNYQLNNTTKLLNFSHNSIFSGANESTVINF